MGTPTAWPSASAAQPAAAPAPRTPAPAALGRTGVCRRRCRRRTGCRHGGRAWRLPTSPLPRQPFGHCAGPQRRAWQPPSPLG
ncbi:MAG: hypothetical protein EBQ53_04755 [Betaproteobacteria bacterium]|nr:hypothetical protein [Betaproteobacteria bacterium]